MKDKRRALAGVKSAIRQRFEMSVAEVDHLDSRKRCTLGAAMIANDSRSVHRQFDKIVDMVREKREVSLIEYDRILY